MSKAVTEITADISYENTYYIVILVRHCTNVEAGVSGCHKHKWVIEGELFNLNNVGWQQLTTLPTAVAKQAVVFNSKR